MNKTISFIGTGNMAYAIIGGLTSEHSSLFVPKSQITLFDANVAQYNKFEKGFNIAATIGDAMKSDIIFLAVKPQNYASVLSEINGTDLQNRLQV